MPKLFYSVLALAVAAYRKTENEWLDAKNDTAHDKALRKLMDSQIAMMQEIVKAAVFDTLTGTTKLDFDFCSETKLVFNVSYLFSGQMTDHRVWITPSLTTVVDVKVSGKDFRGSAEFLRNLFQGFTFKELP